MTRIEDFKTQYERELIYQETNANKRTIKGFVWFLLAVGLVWVFTMLGIFEVDKTMTSIAFFSNVLLYLVPFYLMLRGDLSKPWVKYFLLSFLCLTSAVIISILSYHAVLLYVFPLMYSIHYRKRRLLWFSYFMNLLTVTVSSVLSFYYGICDLNILLQSQHVRSWYMALAADGPLHIPFNEDPLFVILFYMIFPRAIIVLVFTIMMHYTISNNTNEVYRIAQLTYLKDMDASTNVFNKNKYEDMAANYYPGISRMKGLSSLCIEGSHLLLLEMPMCRWTESMVRELVDMSGKNGIILVLAHIDRYWTLQSKTVWNRLLENGILLQTNTSFFTALTTRRKALSLLNEGYVHLLGSDCHNMTSRPPHLGRAFDVIQKRFGADYVRQINEYGYSLLDIDNNNQP